MQRLSSPRRFEAIVLERVGGCRAERGKAVQAQPPEKEEYACHEGT